MDVAAGDGFAFVSLLLIVLSWDIWASMSGGNVELMLLTAIVVAARLLWSARPLLATPVIAFVLLVKPFYVLFFATFFLLVIVRRAHEGSRLWQLAAAGVVTFLLVSLEVFRWGSDLRTAALAFTHSGIEHQWFVLPVTEQTPMSIWNRTPMQGFVNAGVPPSVAFAASFALWCALAAITVWRASKQSLRFVEAFALAFVLLYLGRPVGWTLNYLELVVIGALWPIAGPRIRGVLIGGAVIVMLSHWSALVLTALRVNLWFLALQTADWPWETWSLLPLCWLLLLKQVSSVDRNFLNLTMPRGEP